MFYAPSLNPEQKKVSLSETEARHAIKVLRLSIGDEIELTDGKGNGYKGIIEEANPKNCIVQINGLLTHSQQRNYHLHIAIAPTKNMDRMEWFVEKATEMGVDEVSFIQCHHSERKVLKMERLERIAISAMKQSLKFTLPTLNTLQSFSNFIQQDFANTQKFIAHLEEGNKQLLSNSLNSKQNYLILIGPEGDFSPEEITLSLQKGFSAVSLGNSRLRTETAGMFATALCLMKNET